MLIQERNQLEAENSIYKRAVNSKISYDNFSLNDIVIFLKNSESSYTAVSRTSIDYKLAPETLESIKNSEW
jgi:hypothetical protein